VTIALDTNVLSALWNDNDALNRVAADALQDIHKTQEKTVICGVVYAELIGATGRTEAFVDRKYSHRGYRDAEKNDKKEKTHHERKPPSGGPRGAVIEADAVTQQQLREPMPRPHQLATRVLTRPHQITGRFLVRCGHAPRDPEQRCRTGRARGSDAG